MVTQSIVLETKVAGAAEADRRLKQIGNTALQTERSANRLGSALKTAIGAVAVGQTIKTAITNFGDFDRKMKQIEVATGLSRDQMRAYSDIAREMGVTFGMGVMPQLQAFHVDSLAISAENSRVKCEEALEEILSKIRADQEASRKGMEVWTRGFGSVVVQITVERPRVDDGAGAVPSRKTKLKVTEPEGPKMSRKEKYDFLLSKNGPKCQGCDRVFDDPRYLELDHITPRSDGGIDHISNRVLLCGPCNKLKSNLYTLSGLRRKNQRLGRMAK